MRGGRQVSTPLPLSPVKKDENDAGPTLGRGERRQAQKKTQKLLSSCMAAASKSLAKSAKGQQEKPRQPGRKDPPRGPGLEKPAPETEVPEHPLKGREVVLSSLQAGPQDWGTRATVQRVVQAEGQEARFWCMSEGSRGKVSLFWAQASWCTPVSQLPKEPTPPAPLKLDARQATTK